MERARVVASTTCSAEVPAGPDGLLIFAWGTAPPREVSTVMGLAEVLAGWKPEEPIDVATVVVDKSSAELKVSAVGIAGNGSVVAARDGEGGFNPPVPSLVAGIRMEERVMILDVRCRFVDA